VRRTAISAWCPALRRRGIEWGEIADPSIQSQLDPYGYRAAVRRLKEIGIVTAKAMPNPPPPPPL